MLGHEEIYLKNYNVPLYGEWGVDVYKDQNGLYYTPAKAEVRYRESFLWRTRSDKHEIKDKEYVGSLKGPGSFLLIFLGIQLYFLLPLLWDPFSYLSIEDNETLQLLSPLLGIMYLIVWLYGILTTGGFIRGFFLFLIEAPLRLKILRQKNKLDASFFTMPFKDDENVMSLRNVDFFLE
jgi:hypothetical protein